jgi:hypothetical protein
VSAFDIPSIESHNPPMKIIVLLCALFIAQIVSAESKSSLYDIPLRDINGKSTSLKAYKGKTAAIHCSRIAPAEVSKEGFRCPGFSLQRFCRAGTGDQRRNQGVLFQQI